MKYLLLSIFLLFLHTNSSAQKEDYIWLFGKDQAPEPGLQATQFDFNTDPFVPEIRNGGLSFDMNNTSIADSDGNLLIYSNGCAIANGNHELIENGDGINDGAFFQELWLDDCDYGYPGQQDVLLLNDPGFADGYYLIHKTIEYFPNQDPATFVEKFNYSYIDLAENNGAGKVLEKNIAFHEEKILNSFLTAIRHENGNDWWIIQPTNLSSEFLVFLLNEQGFSLTHRIKAPMEFFPDFTSSGGTAKFSPDGNSYAWSSSYNGLLLYEFDRASGLIENPRFLEQHIPGTLDFASLEFSPNSRFLYLTHGDTLRQLDTWEQNLANGDVLIDTWNQVADPFAGHFSISALGPDCRIYIRMFSSTNSFHVIHEPDQKGLDCNFEQQAIRLPLISARGSLPNHPRFRVDEQDKCDTSIVSMFHQPIYYTRDLKVFPNPVQDWLYLEIPTDAPKGRLIIADAMGRIIQDVNNTELDDIFFNGQFAVKVEDWAIGTYFVEYLPEGHERDRVMYVGKVVVQ